MSSRPSRVDFAPPAHRARKFSQVLGHTSEKSCKSEERTTRGIPGCQRLEFPVAQIAVRPPSAGEAPALGVLVPRFCLSPLMYLEEQPPDGLFLDGDLQVHEHVLFKAEKRTR